MFGTSVIQGFRYWSLSRFNDWRLLGVTVDDLNPEP